MFQNVILNAIFQIIFFPVKKNIELDMAHTCIYEKSKMCVCDWALSG